MMRPDSRFTGKERDPESNLDNFGARYDSSAMGRFMSPDPLGGHQEDPQTLNRYSYVRNNPLSLTDPTGLDFYLQCTPQRDSNGNSVASSTCQQETVGYDKNGDAQTAWVQGVTNDGQFTPTQIGNDANGNLYDKTTGTGFYNATVGPSGVSFSQAGGSPSAGVFVNLDVQTFAPNAYTNIQGTGGLSGFDFTFTNSKLEASQTAAGTFSYSGNGNPGGLLEAAGFNYHFLGLNLGFDEYRSPGQAGTGSNSGHLNVWQVTIMNPLTGVPYRLGDMHFGETNPFTGSAYQHLKEWWQ